MPRRPAPAPAAGDDLFALADRAAMPDESYGEPDFQEDAPPPPDDTPAAPPEQESTLSRLRTKLSSLSEEDSQEAEDDSIPLPEEPPSSTEVLDSGEEKISCTVIKQVYGGREKGFSIVIVRHKGADASVKIKNAAFDFLKGDKIVVKGKWEMYKGRPTFAATSAFPEVPKGAIGVVSWLKSGKVKGVSAGTANKLADVFGDDIENQIGDVDALMAAGVNEKRANAIVEAWMSSSGQAELFSLLARHGLGDAQISKVVRRYGAAAGRIIDENPWVLSDTIDGIGFETADRVAMKAGRARNDPMRYRAALRAAIDQATASEGHCGLPRMIAVDAAWKLLGHGVPKAEIADQVDAVCDGRLHLFDPEAAGNGLIYPVALHTAEKLLAERIRRIVTLAREGRAIPRDQAVNAIQTACREMRVRLDPGQSEAAVTALTCSFSVITGGPGTGKTTTQRVIVKALQMLGKDIALAAPTGRAAKRLSEVSGENASTLHRLLQFSTEAGGFTYNSANPLPETWAIIDESSMVGVKLGHAFVTALGDGAGLTLVGDVDQLPSVDSGQVLRDLIASGQVAVSRLTTVHRQGEDSGIVVAAHRINHGKYPVAPNESLNGFVIDPQDHPSDIINRVIELVTNELPARGYDPLKDIQVMAGMRKGDLGVGALNIAIKEALNPSKQDDSHTVVFGKKTYSVGDRVMQMRNDYQKGVYNGEVGMVKAIGRNRDEDGDMTTHILVDFSGYEVRYKSKDTLDLEQAWACTVHKSQGCEFPVVVFVCPYAHRIMLTRNLVYTAVTRAKTECIVVGDDRSLRHAVDTVDRSRRFTGLQQRLRLGEPEPVHSLPRP